MIIYEIKNIIDRYFISFCLNSLIIISGKLQETRSINILSKDSPIVKKSLSSNWSENNMNPIIENITQLNAKIKNTTLDL